MSEAQDDRKILVCDDDSLMRKTLALLLKNYGAVSTVANTDEVKALLQKQKFNLLMLDIQMRHDREGIEALPEIRRIDPELPIVMMSGLKDFKTVRDAMKSGATDYLSKDFEPEEFELAMDRIFENSLHRKREAQARFEAHSIQNQFRLVGQSPAIQEVARLIEKFRKSYANVLISGETGTGKELVAKLLRKELPHGFEPFVAIDSATLHSGTAESLLFGHEKGAFTGADSSKKGLFEEADGGVIFFDEIANMPISIQAKLLRVLQEKEILRLGSTRTTPLRFRVIAATNRDLEALSKKGEFLPDLLQRLNVLPLDLPPLRARLEDLAELSAHLLAQKTGTPSTITNEALSLMKTYDWPGNVRELSAMLDYSLALLEQDLGAPAIIDVQDLHPKIRNSKSRLSNSSSFYDQVEGFEKNLLAAAYDRCEGNISRVAKELDMDRSHLYAKLKLYGIHPRKN